MNVFEIAEKRFGQITDAPTSSVPASEEWDASPVAPDSPSQEQPNSNVIPLHRPDTEAVLRRWATIPLIEMVPEEYRSAVRRRLEENPNLVRHLEDCKSGVINCWEALQLLGIDPWGEEDNQSVNQSEDKETTNDYTGRVFKRSGLNLRDFT